MYYIEICWFPPLVPHKGCRRALSPVMTSHGMTTPIRAWRSCEPRARRHRKLADRPSFVPPSLVTGIRAECPLTELRSVLGKTSEPVDSNMATVFRRLSPRHVSLQYQSALAPSPGSQPISRVGRMGLPSKEICINCTCSRRDINF